MSSIFLAASSYLLTNLLPKFSRPPLPPPRPLTSLPVCTKVFREFVTEFGLEFYPIGGDPKVLSEFVVKHRCGGGVEVVWGEV